MLDGRALSFYVDGSLAGPSYRIKDRQTDSVWNVLGQAVEGPLGGRQLTPIVHGNHFWFAWAVFRPETIVWSAAGG